MMYIANCKLKEYLKVKFLKLIMQVQLIVYMAHYTTLDIVFAVSKLSRYTNNPRLDQSGKDILIILD